MKNLKNFFLEEMENFFTEKEEFVESFPDIANNLGLFGRDIKDPHVAQLIESYAFLTANLRYDFEKEKNRLLQDIFSIIYGEQEFLKHTYSIIEIKADSSYDLTTGFFLKKGEKLKSEECIFQTIEDIILYPLEIESIDIVNSYDYKDFGEKIENLIKIKIKSSKPLRNLNLKNLKIFIDKDEEIILEGIFKNSTKINCYGRWRDEYFNIFNCEWFIDDSISRFSYLESFFQCKSKFCFFNITNIDFNGAEDFFYFYIPYDGEHLSITKDHFKLFCVGVVNFFQIQTDPIRISKDKNEYIIKPNVFRKDIKISKINKVFINFDEGTKEIQYCWNSNPNELCWSFFKNNEDFYITFIGNEKLKETINDKVFYCFANCTNTFLAENIVKNSFVGFENFVPNKKTNFLFSPKIVKKIEDEHFWNFFSQLRTDLYPLIEEENVFIDNINKLLIIYNPNKTYKIKDVKFEIFFEKVKINKHFIMVEGKKIIIRIDSVESHFFMFCRVLYEFIKKSCEKYLIKIEFIVGKKHYKF